MTELVPALPKAGAKAGGGGREGSPDLLLSQDSVIQ